MRVCVCSSEVDGAGSSIDPLSLVLFSKSVDWTVGARNVGTHVECHHLSASTLQCPHHRNHHRSHHRRRSSSSSPTPSHHAPPPPTAPTTAPAATSFARGLVCKYDQEALRAGIMVAIFSAPSLGWSLPGSSRLNVVSTVVSARTPRSG